MKVLMRDFSRLIFILINFISLKQVTERKRLDSGDLSISSRSSKEVSLPGCLGVTLQVNLLTSLTGGLLGGLVGLDTLNDLLLTLGLADVLNAYMNTLLDDASIDELVHTNTNSGLGNVEDDTSTSMVVLVWHTLVDGRVSEDIDVVTDLNREEVLGEVGHTMLPELLGKHVARTRSLSE